VREGQSIFYSIGPEVPKRKLKRISSLQIAATVAELLGIQPPGDAEGKSVFKSLNKKHKNYLTKD
jgi:arylsulfatase A-like enzyme